MKSEVLTAVFWWVGMGLSGAAGVLVDHGQYGLAASTAISAIGMWVLALIIAIEKRTR
jgi:hypothetical protein